MNRKNKEKRKKFKNLAMVFKMEAALLQQPQWNMNAMMADNEEVDSDEAVSDDEGIEGFNVSPLFFFCFSSYFHPL